MDRGPLLGGRGSAWGAGAGEAPEGRGGRLGGAPGMGGVLGGRGGRGGDALKKGGATEKRGIIPVI